MDKVRIRIVKGTYGYNEGKIVSPKKRGDAVDVDVAKAKRLVEIGVAEYVAEPDITLADTGIINNVEGVNAIEGANNTEGEGLINGCDDDEDEGENTEDALELSEEGLNKLTIPKLAKFAEELEIDTSKFKRKADYVTAILAAADDGAIPEIVPPVIPE